MKIIAISIFGLLGFAQQNTGLHSAAVTVSDSDTGVAGSPVKAIIRLAEEKQTMHSFGASDCWGIKFIGKNWPLAKRNQIADLLFSQEMDKNGNPKGIGLSMWRINIGAGSYEQGEGSNIISEWRREESFQSPDGSYDWTKQAGNRWFAEAAKARGVNNFLLFSISPPVQMTKNAKAFAPNEDTGKLNLREGKMDAFADFLATVTEHYVSIGIPVNYLSPLNEPQWNWQANPNGRAKQEGTPATNKEVSMLVKALSQRLTAKGLSTKIAIGETAALNYAYGPVAAAPDRSDVINYLWNPASSGYIGSLNNVEKIFSSHSYFAQPNVNALVAHREALAARLAKVNASINYWQSEYCVLGAEDGIKGAGKDVGMTTALYVARIIHNDIAIGNASSWQWWLGVTPSDYKDGLVYVSDLQGNMGELPATRNDGIITQSKLLWALGNYSRFVRPGMIRVYATINGYTDPRLAANHLMITAYKNPRTKEFVGVVINMTNKDERLQLNGLTFATDKLSTYTTSDAADLTHAFADPSKEILIAARSIVTITGKYR